MVKQFKQMADEQAAAAARLFDSALAGQVKDSAQQIWLAGMGAFSRAQAEGSKVFESLVKEGASMQKKTQSVAEERINDVAGNMSSMASEVRAKAGQQWDKLEGIFEDRTAKALNKLGVPSAKEVNALIARLDELTAQVAKLSKAAAVKATSAKASGAAAKPAAKTAGRRPSARKTAA